MRLRRDLEFEMKKQDLTVLIIDAMTLMIQEYLGTDDADRVLSREGTMKVDGLEDVWPVEVDGITFIYTGSTRLAVLTAWHLAGKDSTMFRVLVDMFDGTNHKFVAVYEVDGDVVGEDAYLLSFDRETLDFVVTPKH